MSWRVDFYELGEKKDLGRKEEFWGLNKQKIKTFYGEIFSELYEKSINGGVLEDINYVLNSLEELAKSQKWQVLTSYCKNGIAYNTHWNGMLILEHFKCKGKDDYRIKIFDFRYNVVYCFVLMKV